MRSHESPVVTLSPTNEESPQRFIPILDESNRRSSVTDMLPDIISCNTEVTHMSDETLVLQESNITYHRMQDPESPISGELI